MSSGLVAMMVMSSGLVAMMVMSSGLVAMMVMSSANTITVVLARRDPSSSPCIFLSTLTSREFDT